jgi:hypothetical protein
VSSWNAAIFDDDVAADVRDEYRELLIQRVPDDEATRRVLESRTGLGEEEPTLWLALAAAQHLVGRLDETVKARALELIDSGEGLDLWGLGDDPELAGRRMMLARLRGRLTGPQPKRKQVRRPPQSRTDLDAGDILTLTTSTGRVALLRVLQVLHSLHGDQPVAGWLDWSGAMPSADEVLGLPVRDDLGLFRYADQGLAPPPVTPAVFLLESDRSAPTWRDAGFVHLTRVTPAPGDVEAEFSHCLDWSWLAIHLEDFFSDD